jgi:hypothetical protein
VRPRLTGCLTAPMANKSTAGTPRPACSQSKQRSRPHATVANAEVPADEIAMDDGARLSRHRRSISLHCLPGHHTNGGSSGVTLHLPRAKDRRRDYAVVCCASGAATRGKPSSHDLESDHLENGSACECRTPSHRAVNTRSAGHLAGERRQHLEEQPAAVIICSIHNSRSSASGRRAVLGALARKWSSSIVRLPSVAWSSLFATTSDPLSPTPVSRNVREGFSITHACRRLKPNAVHASMADRRRPGDARLCSATSATVAKDPVYGPGQRTFRHGSD